jgi:hypothetical protein
MKPVYLTLIAIVRDQEHYIKEWLTFHRIVGVERFVIILHKCSDETEKCIRELPFIEDIHVHHVIDESIDSVQLGAYHWAVVHYGHYSRWLLFLDTDEFMFGTKKDWLPEILNHYEKYGGLAVHLHHFGSNNHVLRPDGLSIEAFTQRKTERYDMNCAVKSFIQTQYLVTILSPHVQLTSLPVVREHFDLLGETHWGSLKKPSFDIVRCNHYHTRSMEDWVERRKRGSCNTYHAGNAIYDVNRFIERNTGEMVNDTAILRFAKQIWEEIR